LGQGIDIIGCEAFGLERFEHENSVFGPVDQAVLGAEAAVASPFGTEQWRPGALKYILMSSYKEAEGQDLPSGRGTGAFSWLP
jgi:hypothetical protein